MTFAREEPRYVAIHQCSAMPRQGIEIRQGNELSDADPSDWVLSIYREATEGDLEENHSLEQVGEIIWNTFLVIRHCPFCGERLSGDSDTRALLARHFDYAGWDMEER
jgi:hypothetical protein